MKSIAQELDKRIRRRIRMCYWKQWKTRKNRKKNLIELGLSQEEACHYTWSRKSYWRISNTPGLALALDNKTLEKFGYTSLSSVYC